MFVPGGGGGGMVAGGKNEKGERKEGENCQKKKVKSLKIASFIVVKSKCIIYTPVEHNFFQTEF